MHYDLRNSSAEQFERFLFDHEVATDGDAWYHQSELRIDYDAITNARLFTEVFLNAGSLLKAYSPAQLDQGFWAMCGSGFEGNLNDIIWESDVNMGAKEALIASMEFLYRDLFAHNPLEHGCKMFWDILAYDIHPLQRVNPAANSDQKRIQDAMFRTLCGILEIDNRDCQFAALHGMNHVRHPETESVIRAYVAKHPEFTEHEIAYASACALGKAM